MTAVRWWRWCRFDKSCQKKGESIAVTGEKLPQRIRAPWLLSLFVRNCVLVRSDTRYQLEILTKRRNWGSLLLHWREPYLPYIKPKACTSCLQISMNPLGVHWSWISILFNFLPLCSVQLFSSSCTEKRHVIKFYIFFVFCIEVSLLSVSLPAADTDKNQSSKTKLVNRGVWFKILSKKFQNSGGSCWVVSSHPRFNSGYVVLHVLWHVLLRIYHY